MKIISGSINWMEGCVNDPQIEVLVDKIPPAEDFLFEKRGDLYFAMVDGYVKMFAWHGKPDNGFGGSKFDINMIDGSKATLIGPWSSGSYATNAAGFPHSIEVNVAEQNSKYSCRVAGHMFVKMVLRAMDEGVIELTDYMEGKDYFNRSKVRTPLKFPEGSKLILELEGEEAPLNAQFTDMSAEQTLVIRSIVGKARGLIYTVAVRLPDGTIWRKADYMRKEKK